MPPQHQPVVVGRIALDNPFQHLFHLRGVGTVEVRVIFPDGIDRLFRVVANLDDKRLLCRAGPIDEHYQVVAVLRCLHACYHFVDVRLGIVLQVVLTCHINDNGTHRVFHGRLFVAVVTLVTGTQHRQRHGSYQ